MPSGIKVLFTKTGSAKSGSWQIRGVQIAAALGTEARAVVNAGDADIAWADLVVLVKSFDAALVARIKALGKPIVWDMLDFWKQPDGNLWSPGVAKRMLAFRIRASGASLVIATTQAMLRDFDFDYASVIPHHARPDQPMNPIRDRLTAIGYEGSARYLEGGWFAAIGKEAERRRIPFIINPVALADVDIVFAVRGAPWRGYVTDHWKSNVKLANAQATGTPIICLPEAGCTETSSAGGEQWIEAPEQAADAVEALEPHSERLHRSAQLRAAAPSMDDILDRYRQCFVTTLS